MILTSYGRNENPVDEIKQIGQHLNYNKEILLTKQKLDTEWAMNGLGCQNVTCEKLQARMLIFVQTPFSHYIKNRVTKFHATKPLIFSLHFVSALPKSLL